MKTSIYVTFDNLRSDTGAGQVCQHEIEALKKVTELEQVVSREDIDAKIGKHYGFNPFLWDYFAADLASQADILHLSCSPGMALLNKIRPKKFLVNVVAHDLATSIEEHTRIAGTPYPFAHNTDPYLHKMLLAHAQLADVVLTPSEGSAEWIRSNLDVKRIEVIPHGTLLPKGSKALPKEFKPGYLGVWGPDKGLIYLIMAWNHLEYKDVEFQFAGSGCGVLKPLIESFHTSKAIYRLHGIIPEISPFYEGISVYVQPSVTEGFGMPVLEAMAHGRAVIVTEGVGASFLIEDGKEGFIVPIRNPKAIADKLQYLKENRKDLRLMGKRARRTAKKYTWSKIEGRYRKLYASL